MNKSLVRESDKAFEIEVENAVFSCFEYDEDFLVKLLSKGVATTVFEDKLKRENTDVLTSNDDLNYTKVNIWKYGQVPYSSFHSKIMLLEFDDRLRVVVSSANLTHYMWEKIQQVIWVQDFKKLGHSSKKKGIVD